MITSKQGTHRGNHVPCPCSSVPPRCFSPIGHKLQGGVVLELGETTLVGCLLRSKSVWKMNYKKRKSHRGNVMISLKWRMFVDFDLYAVLGLLLLSHLNVFRVFF